MKQPIRIDHVVKHFEGYLVEDTFGEKFYVYKGDWTPRCGGFQWWIDAAHFTFEDTDTWCKVHCDETLEACLKQIQEWESKKINDLLKSKPPSLVDKEQERIPTDYEPHPQL